MIRKILFIYGFFITSGVDSVFAQTPDAGFFLMVEDKTNCPHLVRVLNGPISYCIPNYPVIPESEFKFEGDLKVSTVYEHSSIDLRLTQAGFNTLKSLATNLPNTKLILVIDNFVVGTFDQIATIHSPVIPVNGKINSPEMNWLYDWVKKSRKN